MVKFLATRYFFDSKPTLLLVPLVFLRFVVVVTTGFGVVFWLSSYFRNFSEIENRCMECVWNDPKNVEV